MKPCLCDGHRWLAPVARQAEDDCALLLARIGAGRASGLPGREVRIALGGWRPRPDGMAVSIRWEAAEAGRIIPVLDGDLELAPLVRAMPRHPRRFLHPALQTTGTRDRSGALAPAG